ncbi:serine hydrolase [Nocardiopsis sp. MG754419]|nr:serine hydrolase [Nocardiopsis sp. MG754419]
MSLALPGALATDRLATPPPDRPFARFSPPPVPTVPATATVATGGGSALTTGSRQTLDARVAALGEGVDVGIAVQDLRTGTTYSHNGQQGFPAASVAKLTVLTMLHLRAEEEARDLTAAERARAERMIRFSDNDVVDDLYARMGFTDGFRRHADALGFIGTEPDPGGSWGATSTTPVDQLRLLRALYTDEGPVPDDGRAHIRELMESVAPEQAWGVSAVASAGDTVGLKNGWTPREANGGLWTINSVGHVSGQDHAYLIAVMSDGHPDHAAGVALVEELVTEVVTAIESPDVQDDTTHVR